MFVWKLPKLQSLKIKFSSSSSLSLSLSCVKDANQTVHKKLRDKSALSTSTWLFKHSHLCLCSLQDGLLQFSYFWLPTVDYRKLRTLHETGFQSMRTWSCATSSASFSWVTGPSQNRWQTVNICHNFFSSSSPISLNSLCTPLPGSFILLQTHKYFVSPMLEQKPLANAVSLTALPSDICHIQSSHAFKTALKIHLYKQYHNKWFQILSSCLPLPPWCLIIFFLFAHACMHMHTCLCALCVCVCVCVCVWVRCVRNLYNIMTIKLSFLRF